MFENVEQLEREVQEFKENILASKELLRNLEQLVAAAKAQQEQVAKSTDDLLCGIPATVEEKNNVLCNNMQKTANQMKVDYEAALTKALAEMQKIHQQHIDALVIVENEIKKFEADLTAKYTDFVAKLETSNMSKIFTVCEELKKNVNSKLMLLLGGVGISIFLSFAALIIK